MAIPYKIERKLSKDIWKRTNHDEVERAIVELGIPEHDAFIEFYSKYRGPFGSRVVGHELLDVVDQEESVVSNTRLVREKFDFPEWCLAISTLCGNSVLVYDLRSGCVYDVDFEGGDKLLAAGQLNPRWNSWWEFADEYFS